MNLSLELYEGSTMTRELYGLTNFFKNYTKEKWGEYWQIKVPLVYWLDKLREHVGKPVIIHNAYSTDGHAENSYHYRGLAVDFHVKGMSPVELFFQILKFPFQGVGLYRWGCHTDLRSSGIKKLWRRKNGVYYNIRCLEGISDEIYSTNTG